jgi:hypothetical protein
MRKLLTPLALLALVLTGCGDGKKADVPTSFAPQPNVSSGGAGAAGQPGKGEKQGPQSPGAAKVEP